MRLRRRLDGFEALQHKGKSITRRRLAFVHSIFRTVVRSLLCIDGSLRRCQRHMWLTAALLACLLCATASEQSPPAFSLTSASAEFRMCPPGCRLLGSAELKQFVEQRVETGAFARVSVSRAEGISPEFVVYGPSGEELYRRSVEYMRAPALERLLDSFGFHSAESLANRPPAAEPGSQPPQTLEPARSALEDNGARLKEDASELSALAQEARVAHFGAGAAEVAFRMQHLREEARAAHEAPAAANVAVENAAQNESPHVRLRFAGDWGRRHSAPHTGHRAEAAEGAEGAEGAAAQPSPVLPPPSDDRSAREQPLPRPPSLKLWFKRRGWTVDDVHIPRLFASQSGRTEVIKPAPPEPGPPPVWREWFEPTQKSK
jgi:hypothetical protein